MPFKEGNNLGGRKKGSKNKATTEIRERFKYLLEDNMDRLHQDFDELEPKDRIKAFLDLAQYVVPKLKSTEIKQDKDQPVITIDFTE
ncbi:hypothetical protein [Christiangramia sabulilitoris]|uniref:DUF5681 domain-containing protein n=1 Tax=Christiangramia sabulilitoris TaxID=2583991 RepID=A0A550I3F9_9FLAO|nr:hypothetical protein [Christiangramia sabulilitoris]TRO65489.1 hypothetical protein FGM01_08810 [Christiangramia sabulilitoris]